MEQKEFYNEIYSKHGDETMRPLWVYSNWLKLLGTLKKDAKIVDVGCGTGRFLQSASEAGLRTYGLDISDEAVKVARKNSPKSEINQGAGENLPWENNFFDYVSCLGSLEHFEDVDRGLLELVRVGKQGAKYIIILPNENYFFWKLKKVEKGTKQRDFEMLKSLEGWKKFLSDGGLEVERVYQDKYPSSEVNVFEYKNIKKIVRRIIYKLIWLFMPMKYTYQFIFILKKK